MKDALNRVVAGKSLSEAEAMETMTRLMDGAMGASEMGAFLTALRMKGETIDEITGFARVMREKSVQVPTARRPLVDTCGTGGDTVKTFNISTSAAFVVAGAGVAVAKHGNRAVTSKCGSADVLETLGVRLELTPQQVGKCIDTVGIGFLFARQHHPAMKHAAPVRAELGIRTVFNLLGPLTNPAGAKRQVVGVYDAALCEPLARVLLNLGAQHVLVVHGQAGLDEVASWGETFVAEGRNGAVTTYTLTPGALGIREADPERLTAGCDRREGAAIVHAILNGDEAGPRRDIVAVNAGAALYVAGAAPSLYEGTQIAQRVLQSGAALAKLNELRRATEVAEETTP